MFSMCWRVRRVLPLVLAVACVVCAIPVSSASAALERLPNGQVVSYLPLRTKVLSPQHGDVVFNNLDYNGGALMPSNTDTVVVWAPEGSARFPDGYVAGVQNYFKNLQHDNGGNQNVDSVATQSYNYGTPLGTVNGQNYNQVINGHKYWYQQEWSNNGHTCLQRLTLPSPLPHATFTATAGSGTAMTFDASSSGPSISDFSWQFNDSPPGCTATCNSTIETTAPTIARGFPAAGAYSVGLATFQANGLSSGFGGIVTTGQSGFTPGFTFDPGEPGHGPAGQVHRSGDDQPSAGEQLPVGVRRWHDRLQPHADPPLHPARDVPRDRRAVQRRRLGVPRCRGRTGRRRDDHGQLTYGSQ